MKRKFSKPLLLIVVLILLAALVFSANALYIHCTSDFVTSEDGLWRAGAYRPETFRELWTGLLFYYGDDPADSVVIECRAENYDEVFRYEVPPCTQALDSYGEFLAQKPVTCYYDFHALHFGNPKLVEVTVTWTDSDGVSQTQHFSFR